MTNKDPLHMTTTTIITTATITTTLTSTTSIHPRIPSPSVTPYLPTEEKPNTTLLTIPAPVINIQSTPPSPTNILQPPNLQFLPFTLETKPAQHDFALLSNLSQHFIYWVKSLNASRKLFCSDEYPLSFTGEEAVHIIRALVSEGYKDKFYRNLGRTLLTLDVLEPLPYSERSARKNTLYDSPTEFYTLKESEDGLAQGVCYPLSQCYAPRCSPGNDNCYSPCCPNKTGLKKQIKLVQLLSSSSSTTTSTAIPSRALSLTSSVASSHDTTLSRAWSAMIPREILQSTPESEVKRQEAIHELIYTEEDYVRDLNLLDELFAKPLSTAQCIESDRRSDFCNKIFGNYLELLDLHKNLFKELRDYQGLCQVHGGFVDRVGDIFLRYVSRFDAIYFQYGPNVVLADYNVKKEVSRNMLFQNFIREKEKQAETRKLPFRHFLLLPVTRLQRYSLLLDAVYKRTPDDHNDKKDLAVVTETILKAVGRMDEQAAETKRQLRLLQIHDQLAFKQVTNTINQQQRSTGPDQFEQPQQQQQWTVDDLQLLAPERRLIYEGTVIRRSQLMESTTLHLFLFDHMLIMTKPKLSIKQSSSSSTASPSLPPPVPSHGSFPSNAVGAFSTINPSVDYNAYTVSKLPIPLNFLHIDGTEGFAFGDYSLISSTTVATASTTNESYVPDCNTRPSSPLPTMRFRFNSTNSTALTLTHLGRHGNAHTVYVDSPQQQRMWKEHIVLAKAQWEEKHSGNQVFQIQRLTDHSFGSQLSAGKVNGSVPFTSVSGKRMVVLSTSQGVWIGSIDGSVPYQQVMALTNITQIDIMHENHILLVLADKTLTAYALELLDPSTKRKGYTSQKVSQHVQFFSCGRTMGRSLLVAMKRKGMDSHFKAYEPYCGDLRDPKKQKFLNNKTSFLGKTQPWFRLYKPFYIGAEASAIQLLKARLAIVCERGFEIIDLDSLHDIRNLPDTANDKDFEFLVAPGASTVKPLAMFKCLEGFLLCYDSFFFLVDYKGSYNRQRYDKVEWFGNPEKVAFYHPYIVAFDSQLIEVHHVETGKLVQVFAGKDIQCLCTLPSLQGVMTHPYDPGYQYVFELLPKLTS